MKRFIDCYIPVTKCNLKCRYCYITQNKRWKDKEPEFKYNPEHIRKALSIERLGGICLINLCGGGETLIPRETVDIVRCLLEEGHYVMVVTNGTIKNRIEDILTFPKELLDRFMFKISFQYEQLKMLNMIESFFENINKIREAGCSFSLELTPHDEIIPEIENIKRLCIDNVGALCHVTIARDDSSPLKPILSRYEKDKYKRIWGTFNSELFDFKLKTFGVKRNETCYAGERTMVLNLGTGILKQCYDSESLQNIFEDIVKPINFSIIGNGCITSHCYNSHVFMALGVIPEIETPHYDTLRNRICIDGTEWLTPKIKTFLNNKFAG